MAEKIDKGVIRDLEEIAAQGDRETALSTVPILTAIDVARKAANDNDYQFRVIKFHPRNPENEPLGPEIDALKALESGEREEHVVRERLQIRFFGPSA
jgi:methyl-accepting chemotaxis protein